jgi:GNAT superfamily N-acetyltransferase
MTQEELVTKNLTLVVGRLEDLPYVNYEAVAEIPDAEVRVRIVCQAFDEEMRRIGHLAIDRSNMIIDVQVEPAYRRRGVATRMLNALRAVGFPVRHDWEHMRDDGKAWASSDKEAAGPHTGPQSSAA